MSDKVAALQRSVADLELRLREVVRERDEACDDQNQARIACRATPLVTEVES